MNTEMLERGYGYGVFINWVALVPEVQDRVLPRKLYFTTSFFNQDNLRSC